MPQVELEWRDDSSALYRLLHAAGGLARLEGRPEADQREVLRVIQPRLARGGDEVWRLFRVEVQVRRACRLEVMLHGLSG